MQGPDGDQGSLFDEVLSAVGGVLANRPLYLAGEDSTEPLPPTA